VRCKCNRWKDADIHRNRYEARIDLYFLVRQKRLQIT